MDTRRRPTVSFVLATHNRCAAVADTLARLGECGLARRDFEIIVVDNASTDGTPEVVVRFTPHLVSLDHNAGSCAKTFALDRVRGRFVVFLDDDSHPRPGSIHGMIEHFHRDPALGAAGFTIHLPDGRREGGALPGVFVGCGVGFRTEALHRVGGPDPGFFMQAEEYDLSFKLAAAGWKLEVFDDLHVEHLKTATARKSNRTTYYDICNNLRVAARHLPTPYHAVYRTDFIQRYRWLAERDRHLAAFEQGAWAGRLRESQDRWAFRRRRLSPAVFERFFRVDEVERRMRGLARSGVRHVVLATFGKNVYAFHRGARRAGIEVLAIGDDGFSAAGRTYHSVPMLPMADALDRLPDAIVVSNMSAVQAEAARRRLEAVTPAPVYDWFGAGANDVVEFVESNSLAPTADETDVRAAGFVPRGAASTEDVSNRAYPRRLKPAARD